MTGANHFKTKCHTLHILYNIYVHVGKNVQC